MFMRVCEALSPDDRPVQWLGRVDTRSQKLGAKAPIMFLVQRRADSHLDSLAHLSCI